MFLFQEKHIIIVNLFILRSLAASWTMKFIFVVQVLLHNLLVTNACTEFRVTSEDKSVIVGRSMEFNIDAGSNLIVEPKQYSHTAIPKLECILQSQMKWQNKYSISYLDVLDSPIAVDGLNDAGLSVGALMFPGFAQFQEVPSEKCGMAVSSFQFPLWILGHFGTAQELRDALKKDSFPLVWGATLPISENPFELHYSIIDVTGDGLIIEFTKQGRNEYNNTLGVLTNSPPYDFHMTNIRNYIQLSKFAHDPLNLGPMQFDSIGQGSGLLGVPGDFTPPSRFVRTAAIVHFANEVQTSKEAVMLGFHVLNTVDIPRGVASSSHPLPFSKTYLADYTLWVVVKDLTTKSLYFRDYNDLTIRVLHMAEVKTEGKRLKMKVGNSIGGFVDITDDLTPVNGHTEL